MLTLIPEPLRIIKKNLSPITIANQYLNHEFLKIFWDVKDKPFRNKLKRSIYSMYQRDGAHTYWLLVAGIAEGWRVKQVYRLLTNPGYQWNLELRNISDLTMTGFNPPIVDRLIHRCGRNFFKFAEYHHQHPEFFKKYMPRLKPYPERDQHPVFVYWDTREKQLRLFDGMRRTVLATVNHKKAIKTFVGYPMKKGKPMVNLDKIQYFKLLFAGAKKDSANKQAFVKVGREITRQSSNGLKAFRNSIKPWSDETSKQFIKQIIKK